MRLIDAEYVLWKVRESACPQSLDFGHGMESVIGEIRRAPTVDAEPVVRCKDCIERDDDWCQHFGYQIEPNDYCSYGEGAEHE